MKSDFNVMIIGGGIGGLCLAQGLVKAGISVAVYERDRSPDARLQGYRLNIEKIDSHALHRCLPADLWNALIALAGDPGSRMGVFDEQLHQLADVPEAGDPVDPRNCQHAVSRITLRRLLLAGLDDIAHFDKEFVRYERRADGTVSAYFADGASAVGHLLVGADGVRSRVRKQLLPHAREVNMPAIGIGGKLPLDEHTTAWLPRQLTSSKNMILPPLDFLFTAAFRRRRTSAEIIADSALRSQERLRELVCDADHVDYVLWAYVSHRASGAFRPDLRGSELHSLLQQRTETWHPLLRRLIAETSPNTIESFPFSASAQVREWRTGNVALLGDALHFMPPVGGMGGNAALHDASLLCSALISAQTGKSEIVPALQQYEKAMIKNGFSAVRIASLYTRLAISRIAPVHSSLAYDSRFCAC